MASSGPKHRAHKESAHKRLAVLRHKFTYAPRKAFICPAVTGFHPVLATAKRETIGGVTYCRFHARLAKA